MSRPLPVLTILFGILVCTCASTGVAGTLNLELTVHAKHNAVNVPVTVPIPLAGDIRDFNIVEISIPGSKPIVGKLTDSGVAAAPAPELHFVLPALVTSLIATGVSWAFLPDAPTYAISAYASSLSVATWVLLAGPIAGGVSVLYVRAVAWADRHRAQDWQQRIAAPVLALGLLGAVSIAFPQLLGNGRDVAELAFTGQVAPLLLLALLLFKPAASLLCLGSGAPGGLFTPSLALGALLGGVLGYPWSLLWPGVPPGLFAVLGAAAVLAATTQGPISTVVLMIELTGQARSFILPLLLIVAIATLVARILDARSIYDARLSDEEVRERQRQPMLEDGRDKG